MASKLEFPFFRTLTPEASDEDKAAMEVVQIKVEKTPAVVKAPVAVKIGCPGQAH